jgi:hypothetical protein
MEKLIAFAPAVTAVGVIERIEGTGLSVAGSAALSVASLQPPTASAIARIRLVHANMTWSSVFMLNVLEQVSRNPAVNNFCDRAADRRKPR